MADDLRLTVKNVGGIRDGSFNLKPGLNVIRAPNAAGKTSLVHSLELTSLEGSGLKGKANYVNLFASGAAARALVKLEGTIELERRFRAIGEDLSSSGDSSVYPGRGSLAAEVCFATPGNDLINSVLQGRSVRRFIEEISESSVYDAAVGAVTDLRASYDSEWMRFREDIVRLEEAEKDVARLKDRRNKLQAKLDALPEVDYEAVLEDEKARKKQTELEKQSHTLHEKLLDIQSSLERKRGEIEILRSRLDQQQAIVENVGQTARALEEDLKGVSQNLTEVRTRLGSVQSKLDRVNDEIDMVNRNFEKRQRYGIEEHCVACGQPLSAAQLEQRRKELEEAHRDLAMELKKARREIEDVEDEEDEIQFRLGRLKEAEAEEARLQKSLANRESEASQLASKLDRSRKEYEKIQDEIEDLLKTVEVDILEVFRDRQALSNQIDEVIAHTDGKNATIDQLMDSRHAADSALLNRNAADVLTKHLKTRKTEVMNQVKGRFQQEVNGLLSKLEFEDFEDVRVGDDFRVYVNRSRFNKEWPLSALSTSEQLTLAVAFLLAAKRAYLPDYPFFVLDELITSYDPTRFRSLQEYVASETDYVILTALSGDEGKLTVDHGIQS